MANSQVEGTETVAIPSSANALVEWLKANKIEDKKLIQELIDEGVEEVDDLLEFQEEELRSRLLGSERKIKMGIIGKFMKALKKQKEQGASGAQSNDTQNASAMNTGIIMLDKTEKEAIQKLQNELAQIEQKLKALPQKTKGVI